MNNTGFKDYIAQDLGRFAIKGLITKTAVDPKDIDYVVMGTVIQEGEYGMVELGSLGIRLAFGILYSRISACSQDE